MTDMRGYRQLAGALLRSTLDVLATDPPSSAKPKNMTREQWAAEWERWETERRRDVAFLLDPKRSEVWCDVAGVDREALVSKLGARGLLYDPITRYPVGLDGRNKVFG